MIRKTGFLAVSALCLAVGGLTQFSFGAFAAGDLAVFEAAASSSNTTGSIVELNTTTAGQTPVQTIAIDGSASAANPMRFSGSATSTAYLSHSADGSLVTFTGAATSTTMGNINTFTARAVGALDSTGAFTEPTSYTGTSGNQTRSATSLDDTNWYISDQAGIYTNGSGPASSLAANTRAIKPFGGSVYTLQQSSTATNIVVSTVSAPSGGTITGLPGLTNGNSAQDFYMVSSGQNGSAFDLLYVLDSTSATAGQIDKYSLVSGSWVSNGNATTAFGGFGLAAEETISGNVSLFLTTGNGASINNSVIGLTDTGGYDSAININPASDVTLFTATGSAILKGIDFAPVASSAAPEPASLGLLVLGGAAFLGGKRK